MRGRSRWRSVTSAFGAPLVAALVLSAAPLSDPAPVFAAGDPDCSTGATCVTLHVSLTGSAAGHVWAGDTSGADNNTISCGRQNGSTIGTCAWDYAVRGSSRAIYVTAEPAIDAAVCEGGSCTTGRRTIVAQLQAGTKGGSVAFTFQWINPVDVAVSRTGNGQGTVTSNPLGISCGSTCSYGFPSGHLLSILPHPAAGSEIVDVTVGGTTCWIALYEACNVTPDHNLTVVVTFGIKATPPPATPPPVATPSPPATPRGSSVPGATPNPLQSVRPVGTARPTTAPGGVGSPAPDATADSTAVDPTPGSEVGPMPVVPTPVVPTPFPTADPGSTAGAVAVGGGDQGGGAPSAGPLAPASPSSSGGGIPLWIPLVLAGLLLGFGGAAFLVQRGANRP